MRTSLVLRLGQDVQDQPMPVDQKVNKPCIVGTVLDNLPTFKLNTQIIFFLVGLWQVLIEES